MNCKEDCIDPCRTYTEEEEGDVAMEDLGPQCASADDGLIDPRRIYTEEEEDEVLAFISSEQAKVSSTHRHSPSTNNSIVEWTVGMLDGDGCILLRNKEKLAYVRIAQAHSEDELPATLQRIHRYYGGSFIRRPALNRARPQWELSISQSADNHTLLREMADHGIIKARWCSNTLRMA